MFKSNWQYITCHNGIPIDNKLNMKFFLGFFSIFIFHFFVLFYFYLFSSYFYFNDKVAKVFYKYFFIVYLSCKIQQWIPFNRKVDGSPSQYYGSREILSRNRALIFAKYLTVQFVIRFAPNFISLKS